MASVYLQEKQIANLYIQLTDFERKLIPSPKKKLTKALIKVLCKLFQYNLNLLLRKVLKISANI